ncbi:MAG: DUF6398 domain-containing protein [Planctomycetota bacterium]|nr:DUF6398 domain-containing protein [Planctomycetota bacterium]
MPRPRTTRTTRTSSSPTSPKPMSLKAAQHGLLACLLEGLDSIHHGPFLEVISHTDAYCADHLEPLVHEYHCTVRIMTAMLCVDGMIGAKKKVSSQVWAAAIVATVGYINYLDDPAFPPIKTSGEIAAAFGVSVSSMQAKSREIRKALKLSRFEPDWTLPSLQIANPRIWMLKTTTGIIVDIRTRPRKEQLQAYKAELIPFVPADEEVVDDESSPAKPRTRKGGSSSRTTGARSSPPVRRGAGSKKR